MIDCLGGAGVPKETLWELLSLPISKLDALMKEVDDPELKQQILEHIKVESRTEFRWTKAK